MRRMHLVIVAGFFIVITAYLTYKTFFATFGPVLVDYVAFAAGIVLLTDGVFSIRNSKGTDKLNTIFPFFRIIIGVCIFTIHLLQYLRDGKLGIY